MMYTEKYTNDELFDMFANQADFVKLAQQPVEEIASDLRELAPDMEDAKQVAEYVKATACQITNTQE